MIEFIFKSINILFSVSSLNTAHCPLHLGTVKVVLKSPAGEDQGLHGRGHLLQGPHQALHTTHDRP